MYDVVLPKVPPSAVTIATPSHVIKARDGMNQKIDLMPRVEKGKMTTSLFLMVAQDFDRARTPAVVRHSEPIHATS